MSSREILLGLSCLAIAGCATTTDEGGRKKVVVPTTVSQVYSEVDLQMKLAVAASPSAEMTEDPCLLLDYQRQVRRLADPLVATARRLYPGLAEREIAFRFDVAPSAHSGVLSNAGGNVIVLQGGEGVIPDPVMAYLLAREMGHVIGRHHDENSAATVMFSVITQVLFPAAALVKGLSAILPSTAAGTAVAASTVSYLGATALKSNYREDHLREAEDIANRLMVESGWDLFDVAEAAAGLNVKLGDETWLVELRESMRQLDRLAYGPRRQPLRAAPLQLRFVALPATASVAAASGAGNQ